VDIPPIAIKPAVQQEKRFTLSVHLVIELNAVHVGIAGGRAPAKPT